MLIAVLADMNTVWTYLLLCGAILVALKSTDVDWYVVVRVMYSSILGCRTFAVLGVRRLLAVEEGKLSIQHEAELLKIELVAVRLAR